MELKGRYCGQEREVNNILAPRRGNISESVRYFMGHPRIFWGGGVKNCLSRRLKHLTP